MPEPSAVVSVRAAKVDEASAIAHVQLAAWRADAVLPPERLTTLDADELARSWDLAVRAAPGPRHHVLVALESEAVRGVAALAPSEDPDADPDSDGELLSLHVDPAYRGQGHGSRLLAALTDIAAADGVHTLRHWVGTRDDRARMFLTESGFGPDGASRELDLDGDGAFVVKQLRLHTSISDSPGRQPGGGEEDA